MDLSSELVHALLPVYMTVVLGASMLALGVVEGIAEATASIVKVFSGALSDRMSRRKPLVVLGYALAMLSKPLFPLAASVPLVLAARFMDRLGKGIRGRKFVEMDLTDPELRFDRMAESMGVPGRRVENPDDLAPALKEALAHNGPSLIDVVMESPVPIP